MKRYQFHYYTEGDRMRAYALELVFFDDFVIISAKNREEAWSKAIKYSEKYTAKEFVIESL